MPSSKQIELVIFDVDDVLAHLDRPHRLQMFSRFTGKSAEFIHREIYESDFERSAEEGAYPTGAEYLAEFNRRIDASLTREQWIAARRDSMTMIPETLAIARSLKHRIPVTTLTNNGSLLKESISEILPDVASLFGDDFHASYEFAARKPDASVFHRIVRRYRADEERTLFIDDCAEYIDGAKQAGLNTIHFVDPKKIFKQLTEFGIDCR